VSTLREQKIQAALRKILDSKPPEERGAFLEQSGLAYSAMTAIMRAVVALEDAYTAVDITAALPDRQAVLEHIDDALDSLVTNAGRDARLGKVSVLKVVNELRGKGILKESLNEISGA
jgi:hypothetical protein